jgi:hypothetical protein
MDRTRVQPPIDTQLVSATNTESSDYWGQPFYTAREIMGSLVLVTFARTQAVSAIGEQPDMSTELTPSGLNDGSGGLDAFRFNPAFPASCSFVVSVGATQINSGSTVNDPESACERIIYSGGGFSDIFSIPSYQTAAVTNFLKEHPPPYSAAQFNNSGNVELLFPILSLPADKYYLQGTRVP